MLERTVRFSAIAAMTPLLSVAILISTAHFDVTQAQKGRAAAMACGKELQKLCTGLPVFANNMFECLERNQDKLSKRCAASANNIVRRCERDAMQLCQGNVAGPKQYSRMPDNREAHGFGAMQCGLGRGLSALVNSEGCRKATTLFARCLFTDVHY